jgi:hypothetical protein
VTNSATGATADRTAGVSLAVQLNACFDGNNQVQVFFGNPRCQCVREICTKCIQLVDKLKQK